MKKALITGVTGQDGSYLAEFLMEKGYEVHGLIRRTSTERRERIDNLEGRSGFTLHYGDMTDSLSLIHIIQEVQIISVDMCTDEFNFFTRQEDALQSRLFRYGQGRIIQNHVHNVFPRVAEKTCEMLLVLRGRIRVDIYTNEREFVHSEEVGMN